MTSKFMLWAEEVIRERAINSPLERQRIIDFLNSNPKPENDGYISKNTIGFRSEVSETYTYSHLLDLEKEGFVKNNGSAYYWKIASPEPVAKQGALI